MDERYPYTLTHSDDRSPTKDNGLVLIYRGKIRDKAEFCIVGPLTVLITQQVYNQHDNGLIMKKPLTGIG